MGEILRFPVEARVPVNGLKDHECEAVYAAACFMIAQGQATAVSIADDGQYVCVNDRLGRPNFIGRVDCICYLFDHEEYLLAHSIRFEVVLDALRIVLSGDCDVTDIGNRACGPHSSRIP